MFSDKFDTLMKIAEVSNSQLGRSINMNASYIGRLRSGARPLPQKQTYLSSICIYLAKHIKKDYQISSLQKVTGIGNIYPDSIEYTSLYLEQWLLKEDESSAAALLIKSLSDYSHVKTAKPSSAKCTMEESTFETYLYGNSGKRKAVEQFFTSILKEEKPQTLLLFSDESMTWLYEDPIFTKRWAELFMKAISKGNQIKMIHTVSRDLNEMIESISKWIPIYMTGMIQPYYYPRIRDGIFQRTLFIAPNTAAVISSSVQHDTNEMLNLFITDKSAINALVTEYERYFTLCRPLMKIFTKHNADIFENSIEDLAIADGNSYISCCIPPLFTMPSNLVYAISNRLGDSMLVNQWNKWYGSFRQSIKKYKLSLILLNPDCIMRETNTSNLICGELLFNNYEYTEEEYLLHIDYLKQMENQYDNLNIYFVNELSRETLIYVKENVGAMVSKLNSPQTAFLIDNHNLVSAFWDYIEKYEL